MLIEFEVNFKLPIIGFLPILGRGEKLHDVIEIVLNDSDETVCDNGNMNLDTHSIVTLSPEKFAPEMLLDPFEKSSTCHLYL